jgi:hypothetical protein
MFRRSECPVIRKTPLLQPHTDQYTGLACGLSIGGLLFPAQSWLGSALQRSSKFPGTRFSSPLCTVPRVPRGGPRLPRGP